MTRKQKTAIAALVVAALVSLSAALAPGVKCAPPDPALIEDALGDESGAAAPVHDLGSGSSSDGGSDGGSSS